MALITIRRRIARDGWATPYKVTRMLKRGDGTETLGLQQFMKTKDTKRKRRAKGETVGTTVSIGEPRGAQPLQNPSNMCQNGTLLAPPVSHLSQNGTLLSPDDECAGFVADALAPSEPAPVPGEAIQAADVDRRSLSLNELLPKRFTSTAQVVRSVQNLQRAEKVRSLAYRDNISKTLLHLSKYAADLAETNPGLAVQVLAQIAKMDPIASRRFRLDEEGSGPSPKQASASLQAFSQNEEVGGPIQLA